MKTHTFGDGSKRYTFEKGDRVKVKPDYKSRGWPDVKPGDKGTIHRIEEEMPGLQLCDIRLDIGGYSLVWDFKLLPETEEN